MDVDNPREVTQEEAQQLWNSDAQSVFRSFRDHAITLIEIVARVHYLCGVSDRTTPVAQLFEPMREYFDVCRCTAKNMWWSTPLPSYLTRPRPIVVFELGTRRTRLDGSCFHEVAINFSDSLDGCAQDRVSAHEYLALLRFQTGRGDEVTDYLKSLVADIRCEWQEALERFRQSKSDMGPDKSLTNGRVGAPLTHGSQDQATPSLAPAKPLRFAGGELVFFPDRVELCGVVICSDDRPRRMRDVLDLLRQKRADGSFVFYGGTAFGEKIGIKETSVAGLIRDLRDHISEVLGERKGIECGRLDVIQSRGGGYRLSQNLSVHEVAEGSIPPEQESGGRVIGRVFGTVTGQVTGSVIERRMRILQVLVDGHQLRLPAISLEIGCPERTIRRDLDALRADGKVEFVGAPRTGYYRLREAAAIGQ